MSWSPDLFIGELRPWPDTVHVVRGKTDEMRRYVPEEMLFHERDGHDEQFELARSLQAENAELRELVRQMAYAISPTSRKHMLMNLAEQGIEVDG